MISKWRIQLSLIQGDGIYISVESVEHKEVARPEDAGAVELDQDNKHCINDIK